MSARPLLLAAAALTTLLLLAACGPTDLADAPTETPEPAPSDVAAPEDEFVIPDDATLIVEGVATASNGAVADFRLVVHAPAPYDADIAGDAVLATETWCAGEYDIAALAAQDFSFTDVDVTMTLQDGSATWPGDAPLLVLPLPWTSATIASTGDVHQVDQPTLMGQGEGSIPHCVQPAIIDGPGEGVVYLGIAGDKTGADGGLPFTAWANHKYGLNANLPGDLAASSVTFSVCSAIITPLGEEWGAPTDQWQERFESAFCVVGGATGGE